MCIFLKKYVFLKQWNVLFKIDSAHINGRDLGPIWGALDSEKQLFELLRIWKSSETQLLSSFFRIL